MKNIFNRGYFRNYANKVSISDHKVFLDEMYHSDKKKISVFMSHKHSDLDDLKGIIGYFQSKYDIVCYIDGFDKKMPNNTSDQTARRIKQKIKECNKFILLATNDAIKSNWCNWELGYGDAHKYINNIAIFPMCDNNENDYIGNEYLQIYPHIVKREKGDTYDDGKEIEPGYYIRYKKDRSYYLRKFETWLERGIE